MNNQNGLNNLGNTCYFNSCIQMLYHCDKLVDWFLKKKIDYFEEETLSYQFYRLMKGMREYNTTISPESFWKKFKNIYSNFDNYNQHDSQEALFLILDRIHEELKKRNNRSIIYDLFKGSIETKYKCLNCKNISKNKEIFLNLTLTLPDYEDMLEDMIDTENEDIVLKELINYNYREEKIENYKCEKCDDYKEALKKIKILKLPKILLIYLKRFEYNRENNNFLKIRDDVKIEEELEMEEYFGINSKYKWNNSIIQLGSYNGGHYINIAKYDNNYYIFDDSNVKKNTKKIKEINEYYNQSYVYCYDLIN